MILLIDNYDSFSYNLYQLIGKIADGREDIRVIRNDELSVQEIEALSPSHIIISPGPGRPENAGICQELIASLSGKIPILGVCLGHQAMYQAFGGTVGYASALMHGKQRLTVIDSTCPIFEGLPEEIPVARYHSLAADKDTMPDCLLSVAHSKEGEIMAIMHKEHKTYGLQFHPESIMTPDGNRMLTNFLKDSLK